MQAGSLLTWFRDKYVVYIYENALAFRRLSTCVELQAALYHCAN